MKKKYLKCSLAIIFCLSLLWSAALPAFAAWSEEDLKQAAHYNLLENGGFEDGMLGWTNSQNAAITNDAYSGKHGLALGTAGEMGALRQEFTFPEGGDYVLWLSVKLTSEKTGTTTSAVNLDDVSLAISTLKNNHFWQYYSIQFTVPAGAAGRQGKFFIMTTAPVQIDNIYILPVNRMPPPIPTDPQQNSVANAGFEAGTDGWSCENGNISQSNEAHSGTHSMRVERTQDSSLAMVRYPIGGLKMGTYELTCYVKAESQDSVKRTAMTISGKDNGVITATNQPLPDGWRKISILFQLAENYTELLTVNINFGFTGALYVDDVSLTPVGAQAQNLLQNPGFEANLSGWTQQGMPNSFAIDSQAYSGTHAAYFGYFVNEPLVNYLQQTCAAGAGRYTLSAMVKPDATLKGVGCMLMLEALDKNGAVLATATSPGIFDPAKGWQRALVSLNAPAGTASLRAKVGGVYCTGAFYADDICLWNA